MKNLLIACLLTLAGTAHAQAAPNLYANEASVIDTASLVINGAGSIPCVVGTNPNGNIKCPLDSITTPGTYQLAIKVVQNASVVSTPTGATNNPGGSAVSAPFPYTLNSATVVPPGNPKVGP